MARLTAIELTRWRSFERTQRLELRPLTLIFGWNNTGKSALLRALPIIADSVRDDAVSPLNLTGPAARGANFRDVSWKRSRKGLSIALEWEGTPTPRYEVDLMLYDSEGASPRILVDHFAWRDEKGALTTGNWLRTEPVGSKLTYQTSGSPQGRSAIQFSGLTPRTRDRSLASTLAGLAPRLDALDTAVQWIGSVRVAPLGPVVVPEGIPRLIAPDGSDCVTFLQSETGVLRSVNEWFREHAARELELQQIAPGFVQPAFRHLKSSHAQRLADHGEGLLQVLPVLTALARARREESDPATPRMLAIEDPESHLHPRLQHALANHFASVAMSATPPSVVLETHSQHFLLAVQLAVARGDLDPSRVAIYWVAQDTDGASDAVRIDVEANGDLRDWPPGIYDDVVDMARDLTARRWGISQ
jgi:predicted ATPase